LETKKRVWLEEDVNAFQKENNLTRIKKHGHIFKYVGKKHKKSFFID